MRGVKRLRLSSKFKTPNTRYTSGVTRVYRQWRGYDDFVPGGGNV